MAVSRAGRYTLSNAMPYWKYAQARRQRLQAAVQQFQQDAQLTSAAFSNAVSAQITGTAELAARASVKRIQQEIQLARQGAAGLVI